ncbi:MAG: hypothetical protein K6G07_02420 [Lachnospiraceae bacterium]|nr:hypothetical protein [Lachnospiraceae bacterium]
MDKKPTEYKIILAVIAAYGVLGLASVGVYASQNFNFDFSAPETIEEETVADTAIETPEEEAPWVRPVWSGKLTAGAEFFAGSDEDDSVSGNNASRPVHLLPSSLTSVSENTTEEALTGEDEKIKDDPTDEDAETASEETDDGALRAGPYYSFTVTELPFDTLSVHTAATGGGGSYGSLSAGSEGYVIEKGDVRTLVYCEGVYGYVSNLYIELTEVSGGDYPSELKKVTADNVPLDGQEVQ